MKKRTSYVSFVILMILISIIYACIYLYGAGAIAETSAKTIFTISAISVVIISIPSWVAIIHNSVVSRMAGNDYYRNIFLARIERRDIDTMILWPETVDKILNGGGRI